MAWNGNRTDRLEMPRQLRVDAEMGRKIRMRADVNRRTIQQEILHLIDVGLQSEEVGVGRAASDSVSCRELSPAGPVRSRQAASQKKSA